MFLQTNWYFSRFRKKKKPIHLPYKYGRILGNVLKNYDKPYADVEFSNGRIEKRLFVYTADGRQVNQGDEVYVCIIENEVLKDLQFCEVRLVSELGKVSSQKSQKRKKSEKKKKSHAR